MPRQRRETRKHSKHSTNLRQDRNRRKGQTQKKQSEAIILPIAHRGRPAEHAEGDDKVLRFPGVAPPPEVVCVCCCCAPRPNAVPRRHGAQPRCEQAPWNMWTMATSRVKWALSATCASRASRSPRRRLGWRQRSGACCEGLQLARAPPQLKGARVLHTSCPGRSAALHGVESNVDRDQQVGRDSATKFRHMWFRQDLEASPREAKCRRRRRQRWRTRWQIATCRRRAGVGRWSARPRLPLPCWCSR